MLCNVLSHSEAIDQYRQEFLPLFKSCAQTNLGLMMGV
jgi:hypothetical protein